MINGKKIILPAVILSIAALFVLPATNSEQLAFADSEKIVVKASKQLQKNPLAMKILAEMEKQKLQYKQKMEQKVVLTAQQKEIEEQRDVAQQRLEERLDAFMVKYEDHMPKSAFSRFVEKKPDTVRGVFWGMFDYMQGKVDKARDAMKQVLDNGGSLREARDAYFEKASTTRVQLIEVTKDLNIQHGLAEQSVQDTFDVYGKLPRYDDT